MKEVCGQLSLFEDSGEEITEEQIRRCLARGSGYENGRLRIAQQYRKGEPENKNIAFLKKEYGIGGMWPVWVDGCKHLSMDYDSAGIRIGIIGEKTKVRLPWDEVSQRLGAMIAAGEWEI